MSFGTCMGIQSWGGIDSCSDHLVRNMNTLVFLQLFFYSFPSSDQMRKRENIASKDGFWSGYFEKISSFFFFPHFHFQSKSLSQRCQESRSLDFSDTDLSAEHLPSATHRNTATIIRGKLLISQSSILQTRKLKLRNNEQLIKFI